MTGAALEVVKGPAAGRRIEVGTELVIGREATGDGHLDGDEELSRRHARFSRGDRGELILDDLGSTNGTRVNGQRLATSQTLVDGDLVELGQTTLRVIAPAPAETAESVRAPRETAAPSLGPAAPTQPPAPAQPTPGDAAPAVRGGRARPPAGRPSVISAGLPGTMRGRVFPSVGFLMIQLIVAWEFFASALPKIFRGGFVSGLGDDLQERSAEASGWFRSFLEHVVIPNGQLFAVLVILGELFVGAVLAVTALMWIFRWETMERRTRDRVLLGTVVACATGIFLNLQFYLAGSADVPFFIAKEPFDEGVGLDILLPVIQLVLGGVALWTYLSLRRARVRRPTDGSGASGGGDGGHVVIAGGGFGGLSAARSLEEGTPDNVRITLVSDANFHLYTPLLPAVAGGGLEPSSIAVPLREELGRTDVRLGRVTGADPGASRILVESPTLGARPGREASRPGDQEWIAYDQLVVALGSVSRPADIPGLAEHAIGFKTLSEAVALRNWLIRSLDTAEGLDDPAERAPYLTYVFVGAGFAGLEAIAELQAFAARALRSYPRCRFDGTRWMLVEAGTRVMPEVDPGLADYAVSKLEARGIEILTGARLVGVGQDRVQLSTGEEVPARTVVWTAGVRAHPAVAQLGLRIDERGRIATDADLRVQGQANVWAIGDAAAVANPIDGGNTYCPPTAEHATRQGTVVGENIAAAMRFEPASPYTYGSRGAFVDLGRRTAVARTYGLRWRGLPAWLLARAFHASRLPGRARKVGVLANWGLGALKGVEAADLSQLGHPGALLGTLQDGSSGGTSGIHVRPGLGPASPT